MIGLPSFLVRYGTELYHTLYVFQTWHTWSICILYTAANTALISCHSSLWFHTEQPVYAPLVAVFYHRRRGSPTAIHQTDVYSAHQLINAVASDDRVAYTRSPRLVVEDTHHLATLQHRRKGTLQWPNIVGIV